MIAEYLVVTLIALIAYFIWSRKRTFRVFKDLGIPGPEPSLLFGNSDGTIDGQSVGIGRWTKRYGKTFGYFEGTRPILVTSDLDFLKNVFIKNFSKFVARKPLPIGPSPSAKNINLITAHGRRWKRLRSAVSPTFSTNKLKQTTPLVTRNIGTLMEILDEKIQEDKPFNIMELFQGLTLDVISSTAFGLDIDAQRNQGGEFIQKCRDAFAQQNFRNKSLFGKTVFSLVVAFPGLRMILYHWIRFLQRIRMGTFSGLWLGERAREIVAQRKKQTEVGRMDLLQIMLDLEVDYDRDENSLTMNETGTDDETSDAQNQDNHKLSRGIKVPKKMTQEEIVSSCVVFLLAGYETTSTALSYAAYELALHPNIQSRLQQEIDSVLDQATPDYQSLSKLPYLDMVFNEVLRKHPIAPTFVTRQCEEETTINGIKIPKGMVVMANMIAVHDDPEIWGETDPNLFDPDRFEPEQKASRNALAFMAFGIGPRNCVGMRFALMEGKLALATLLQKYTIEQCEKTEIPLEVIDQATRVPKNGVYVRLTRRQY